ncbi:MAG: glycosyltransferase [Terriglobales bacterium]
MTGSLHHQPGLRWTLVSGEYPGEAPCGGVGAYTAALAAALGACGDAVEVFSDGRHGALDPLLCGEVRALPGWGLRGLWRLHRSLRRRPPGVLLIEYVPHAFGWKAMNVAFAAWVRWQAPAPVWIMFHEVAYPQGARRWRHRCLAAVTRCMARWVACGAERCFVSTTAWQDPLKKIASHLAVPVTLPIPSNVPLQMQPAAQELRAAAAPGAWLGHFGTYSTPVAEVLGAVLPRVLAEAPECRVLLLGHGSQEFAGSLQRDYPALAGRIRATGTLPGDALAAHLQAATVLLQPYPDGVTTRRGSIMAGLGNGCAIVTSQGALTEPLWSTSGAVRLALAGDVAAHTAAVLALWRHPEARDALARRAREFYEENFALEHTVNALRKYASGALQR